MVNVYLSQPCTKDREQEARIIKKAVLYFLCNNEAHMKLDQKNQYSFVPYLPMYNKFTRNFIDSCGIMIDRFRSMKHADYFIFIKHWEDQFEECRLDKMFLKAMDIVKILDFQIIDGKAILI